MKNKRFIHKNEGFICEYCHKKVLPASSGCRDHCPFCLYSKHVDINPGDRLNDCGGLMKPIGYELSSKKGIVIIYKCIKCRKIHKNLALLEDNVQKDNYERILQLSFNNINLNIGHI